MAKGLFWVGVKATIPHYVSICFFIDFSQSNQSTGPQINTP